MICTICDRPLARCICDDIDERIESLSKSPFLAIDWDALKAARHLAKFEIDRDRADAAKKPSTAA